MRLDLSVIPPQGNFADVNGIQMYYETYGQGEPLVLMHGFTSTSLTWRPYVEELAEHFRVIVPDLRGHGRSLDPAYQITLAQFGMDVLALMDQLEIDRFKAIGCSGGGCGLQYMASWQPQRLDSIILESSGHYFDQQTSDALLSVANEKVPDSHPLRNHHVHGVDQIQSLRSTLPKVVAEYNSNLPDITKFMAKTLIVFGDRDHLYPVTRAVEMYIAIDNAYLWIVPNAAHAFTHDDPETYVELFTGTALEFLLGKWERALT